MNKYKILGFLLEETPPCQMIGTFLSINSKEYIFKSGKLNRKKIKY